MKRWLSRRTLKLLMILLVIYVIGGIIFYVSQERLMFHPKRLAPDHKYSFQHPHTEYNIAAGKDNLHFVKFPVPAERKGIVLYFHGNMSNLERYAAAADIFTQKGYEIWMIDYPGFGKTTGRISEERLYADALKMYEMAAAETNELIIYGRSIGTGVASWLASERECKQLLLETPYYSMPELAKSYAPLYPVKLLLKYRFPTNEYLQKTDVPVTIFHGTEDELIPYHHAEKLFASRDRIRLVTIRNGQHNDLMQHSAYHEALDSVLK